MLNKLLRSERALTRSWEEVARNTVGGIAFI